MEKNEPSFVPEWLRSNLHGSNSGGSGPLFPSSSSYTEKPSLNRPSQRSSFTDRSSSSNTRKVSSNGSSKNAYSNFNRNQRDKDYDFIGTLLSNRSGNGTLKPSQPIAPRKQANGNGLLHKTVLEKDFPSLDKQTPSSISDAVQLASSISTINNHNVEKWTSALVDCPPQAPSSGGLNMAEALTQIPPKTRAPNPPVPKREEIAIKQSRQLIPVTPSTTKASSKPKSASKMDPTKPQHGKLQVLKPGWENTFPQSPKEKQPLSDRKVSTMNLMAGLSLEKKPSLSQTQSRTDFFNYLKKKTSPPATSSASNTSQNDAVCSAGNDDNTLLFSEEETAFLRSLGWDENSGEEGLTEEEINSFYKVYKPARKMNGALNVSN